MHLTWLEPFFVVGRTSQCQCGSGPDAVVGVLAWLLTTYRCSFSLSFKHSWIACAGIRDGAGALMRQWFFFSGDAAKELKIRHVPFSWSRHVHIEPRNLSYQMSEVLLAAVLLEQGQLCTCQHIQLVAFRVVSGHCTQQTAARQNFELVPSVATLKSAMCTCIWLHACNSTSSTASPTACSGTCHRRCGPGWR